MKARIAMVAAAFIAGGAAVAAAFIAGGAAGAAALFAVQAYPTGGTALAPAHPVWTEVAWPFPVDEWGTGKAFRCAATDCGTEVVLYLRAKIGFCDCTNGVKDDDELDRLADFGFMGSHVATLDKSRPLTVGWMKGRSRPYAIAGGVHAKSSALAVAFNDHCDAIVATAVFGHDRPALLEPSVSAFLNGKIALDWTKARLGL